MQLIRSQWVTVLYDQISPPIGGMSPRVPIDTVLADSARGARRPDGR